MIPKLKVGIVGAKFAAEFHIKSWRRVPGVEIQLGGITSRQKDSAKAVAKQEGIRCYPSLDKMLGDSTIQVIDICAPDYAHEEIAVRSFEAGKHVIVEKLLTGFFGTDEDRAANRKIGFEIRRVAMIKQALASCQRIRSAEQNSGKTLMYAENWVYAPAVAKVAELLSQGPRPSKILYIESEESHRGSHSPAYGIWALHGSGATSGKLCHPIGAALRLKYEEGMRQRQEPYRPVTVTAWVTRHWADIENYAEIVGDNIRTDYLDVEDGVYALIRFDDQTIALVKSNEYKVGGVYNTLRVDASDQHHRVSIAPNLTTLSYAADPRTFGDAYLTEKVDHRGGHQFPAAAEDYDLGYYAEMEHFARHVAFDEPLLSGFTLARDTVLVCYGALLSAERKGQEVDLTAFG